MNLKITVKIAIFVSPKQRVKQRDKITYRNLDSARTPVPHNYSMPPTLPSQRELVVTDSSAVEDHTNELISSNYIDSDTTEDPILFSQKHLNNLIRDLCISKEKGSSLHPAFN